MKEEKYPCTECGKNAWLGYSNWKNKDGDVVIKKSERLCTKCKDQRFCKAGEKK